MTNDATRAALARVVEFYEALSADDLDRIPEIYAEGAYFRDPFNEIRGLPRLREIFLHMFANLADARFKILETVADERGALLTWDMTFRIRKWKPDVVQTIHGATHLRFDATGKVAYHRDYWDTGEELYAKLPLIGPVVQFLRRKLR
jgi:limonene-1,2-epoxide hydrolase